MPRVFVSVTARDYVPSDTCSWPPSSLSWLPPSVPLLSHPAFSPSNQKEKSHYRAASPHLFSLPQSPSLSSCCLDYSHSVPLSSHTHHLPLCTVFASCTLTSAPQSLTNCSRQPEVEVFMANLRKPKSLRNARGLHQAVQPNPPLRYIYEIGSGTKSHQYFCFSFLLPVTYYLTFIFPIRFHSTSVKFSSLHFPLSPLETFLKTGVVVLTTL